MTSPAITLQSLETAFAKQFTEALAEVNTASAVVTQKKTIAARKKEWVEAIETLDVEKLEQVDQAMQSYVTELATIKTADVPTEMTTDQTGALMAEYIRLETINEFLQVRREIMKVLVFSHLDTTVGPGKPGAIKVTSLKKQFKREGGGQADPTINMERLAKVLGDDFSKVIDVEHKPAQVTPATTVATLSETKLIALIKEDPSVLERITKGAVDPGKDKTARFQVRDLA